MRDGRPTEVGYFAAQLHSTRREVGFMHHLLMPSPTMFGNQIRVSQRPLEEYMRSQYPRALQLSLCTSDPSSPEQPYENGPKRSQQRS